MPDRTSKRKSAPGAENHTIPASGGQSFPVADVAPTPSMSAPANSPRRDGPVLDPVTGEHVFD